MRHVFNLIDVAQRAVEESCLLFVVAFCFGVRHHIAFGASAPLRRRLVVFVVFTSAEGTAKSSTHANLVRSATPSA